MVLHRPESLAFKDALIVGLFQCLAIIPGVSRAGICMTAGRLLAFDRPLSARFSLLLAMPTLAAAGLLAAFDLRNADARLTADALVGGVLSFVFALIAVALMMGWLRRATYMPFVVYRVALGLVLLVLVYGFGWSPDAPPIAPPAVEAVETGGDGTDSAPVDGTSADDGADDALGDLIRSEEQ
jgi:undecaprenyl-diphosphatase